MEVTHKGPATIRINKGEPIDIVVQLIAAEKSGRGFIWGTLNFTELPHGFMAEIFLNDCIIPIMITGTDLAGPTSFIVIGQAKFIY